MYVVLVSIIAVVVEGARRLRFLVSVLVSICLTCIYPS